MSANSTPSAHSSLSIDSRTDETQPALVFMRAFVDGLFEDSGAISLDAKADFGRTARVRKLKVVVIIGCHLSGFSVSSLRSVFSLQTEVGRVSFARLISSKRSACKKVNESTFYSLIQYFAIVLFECCDSEDYSPAKILMNMCFTFYHEGESATANLPIRCTSGSVFEIIC